MCSNILVFYSGLHLHMYIFSFVPLKFCVFCYECQVLEPCTQVDLSHWHTNISTIAMLKQPKPICCGSCCLAADLAEVCITVQKGQNRL